MTLNQLNLTRSHVASGRGGRTLLPMAPLVQDDKARITMEFTVMTSSRAWDELTVMQGRLFGQCSLVDHGSMATASACAASTSGLVNKPTALQRYSDKDIERLT